MVIFVCNRQQHWKDGLWRALQTIGADIHYLEDGKPDYSNYKFALAWGDFNSEAEREVRTAPIPKGLCIGGCAQQPYDLDEWDILFYETNWYGDRLDHKNKVHAFGVNTNIFKPIKIKKLYDYLSVGSFSYWKRQDLLTTKKGVRLCVGQVQQNNLRESLDIASRLITNGVGVLDLVAPETLSYLYNQSRVVYIPAEVHGGGERAVLEARACDIPIEIEDNPKLEELLHSPVWDHKYYARQLANAIEPFVS